MHIRNAALLWGVYARNGIYGLLNQGDYAFLGSFIYLPLVSFARVPREDTSARGISEIGDISRGWYTGRTTRYTRFNFQLALTQNGPTYYYSVVVFRGISALLPLPLPPPPVPLRLFKDALPILLRRTRIYFSPQEFTPCQSRRFHTPSVTAPHTLCAVAAAAARY